MDQLRSFLRDATFVVKPNYTDFKWLAFHTDLIVTKLRGGLRRITMRKGTDFLLETNPHDLKRRYVYLPNSPCKHLRPDQKCAIYRSRPEICKRAPCLYEGSSEKYLWFGRPLRDEIQVTKKQN
jgi:Fe-S-cluster containining protein